MPNSKLYHIHYPALPVKGLLPDRLEGWSFYPRKKTQNWGASGPLLSSHNTVPAIDVIVHLLVTAFKKVKGNK